VSVPDLSAEIDRLAQAAQAAPPSDLVTPSALWEAVFGLERWWFPTTSAVEPRPFLGRLPEGPALLAFTSGERARAWSLGNGAPEEQASRVLSMSPDLTVTFLEQNAGIGIEVLAVDVGITGFFAPVANLRPMQQWIESQAGAEG
jgi:hypothetical protein